MTTTSGEKLTLTLEERDAIRTLAVAFKRNPSKWDQYALSLSVKRVILCRVMELLVEDARQHNEAQKFLLKVMQDWKDEGILDQIVARSDDVLAK